MDAELWKQIDEIFDAALDLPEAEREAYLSAECKGDEELKNKLRSLLKATTTTNFLERSAMGIVAKNLADELTNPFHADLSGRKLDTYKIENKIGAGGMGEVFLAYDEKLKRKVALKILAPEYTSSDDRVVRFELEARAISALNHPNIVTIYDVGNSGGINYIATEYVEGRTLRELIGTNLKLKEIFTIILQVCDALAAAHSARIIHRDIKPENIMVRPDGYVKILDFGLAKLNEVETGTSKHFTNTAKGIIIGTPAYMSPEQVAGDEVDHRTDLWSIGVVLYELSTGINPFKKENRQATFQAILSEEPQAASSLQSEIPPELDRILVKALEKEADLSYQTATDLRADIKRVKREIDSAPSWSRTNTSAENHAPAKSQSLIRFSIPLFLLLVSIGAGIWFFLFYKVKPEATDWSKAIRTQLTDQPGSEIFPSLAPDGKSFVFAAKSGREDYDLFLQRVGDKKARNITEESTGNDTQPAFSPDGERIAFRSERDGAPGVYIMSATGENVRRLSDFGYHPSWSPTGGEIVVSSWGRDLPDVRNPNESSLWIINVETGEKRLLIESHAMHPSWSPDGKFIAYYFYPPNVGRRDIAIIPASGGGEPLVVTRDGTTNWNPVWSSNGKYLYYASDRLGNMNFWRVSFDGDKFFSEPEAVETPSKYSRHLSFSRDGSRLIYVSTDNKSNIGGVEFDPKTEKPIGEPFWITRGDREISRPELSPDGRQFVYRLSRRTQDDIVVVNRDGTNPRDLTNDAAFDRYPRWSPDGKKIAFASDRSGVYEIWTIDADGTNLRQITFTGKNGTSIPVWSPDGRQILYRCAPRLCAIDVNKSWTEQTQQVLPDYDPNDRQRFVAWDWSPDGAHLVGSFSGDPMDVGFYTFAGNRFEPFGKMDSFPMWLQDSRRFIYGFEDGIFIADSKTKKTRPLDLNLTEDLESVGISRDGKLIYYTLFSSESDIWLLDNRTQPIMF